MRAASLPAACGNITDQQGWMDACSDWRRWLGQGSSAVAVQQFERPIRLVDNAAQRTQQGYAVDPRMRRLAVDVFERRKTPAATPQRPQSSSGILLPLYSR